MDDLKRDWNSSRNLHICSSCEGTSRSRPMTLLRSAEHSAEVLSLRNDTKIRLWPIFLRCRCETTCFANYKKKREEKSYEHKQHSIVVRQLWASRARFRSPELKELWLSRWTVSQSTATGLAWSALVDSSGSCEDSTRRTTDPDSRFANKRRHRRRWKCRHHHCSCCCCPVVRMSREAAAMNFRQRWKGTRTRDDRTRSMMTCWAGFARCGQMTRCEMSRWTWSSCGGARMTEGNLQWNFEFHGILSYAQRKKMKKKKNISPNLTTKSCRKSSSTIWSGKRERSDGSCIVAGRRRLVYADTVGCWRRDCSFWWENDGKVRKSEEEFPSKNPHEFAPKSTTFPASTHLDCAINKGGLKMIN